MDIQKLSRNIRFYILLSSALLAGAVFFYVKQNIQGAESQTIKLTQTYGLITITYLYLTLLASPLTRFFSFLPLSKQYIFARRAIGVSVFIFAMLHSYFAFFGELGGFEGIKFLGSNYLIAITLSTVSLIIITLLTLTASDWAIAKLSYKKWKYLHRFVYLSAFLTTIHALMLGSSFTDFLTWIPQVFSLALAFLLVLESIRFDIYLHNRYALVPRIGPALFITSLIIGSSTVLALFPNEVMPSLSLHEAHKQLAAQVQKEVATPNAFKNIPGLQGDRTRRFSVDTNFPDVITPGVAATLKFRVFDASSGAPISVFTRNYEKLMHLIIVDNDLNNFQHIHPDFKQSLPAEAGNYGWFEITATFPHDGRYHLYMDFLPAGAIEQQFAFPLDVGDTGNIQPPQINLQETSVFTTGNYNISLSYDKPLKAVQLTLGAQSLNFKITDLQGNPITNLKPYLGAFGHLVMINTQSFDYLHVHPYQIGNLQPDQSGGPDVTFMPLGIYGPIKPGIYKIFAQFNPDNNLILSEFIVKVH